MTLTSIASIDKLVKGVEVVDLKDQVEEETFLLPPRTGDTAPNASGLTAFNGARTVFRRNSSELDILFL